MSLGWRTCVTAFQRARPRFHRLVRECMPSCFLRGLASRTDIWERQGILCHVDKKLTLSRSLATVLNSDVPLPQPQTRLQPIHLASPQLFDMYPRLSPATRLSLTPSRGLTACSSLWKQSQPGPDTRGTALCGCCPTLVQSHS